MTKHKNLDDQASFSAPIEDLQVRIAFLDDLVEQLNDQVVQQSLELADLKKQMQLLYQRVESSDLSEGIA
ncbi:MAG: SlyX family protein, partial [Acinetobacter sp.]